VFSSILVVHTLCLEQFYSCTYKFSLLTSLCTHVLDCAPCNIRTATGYSGCTHCAWNRFTVVQ
jgi:hypothetical protein